MSRIKRLVRPQAEPSSISWKLALPALGLALSAAIHAHAGTTPAKAPVHVTLERRMNELSRHVPFRGMRHFFLLNAVAAYGR